MCKYLLIIYYVLGTIFVSSYKMVNKANMGFANVGSTNCRGSIKQEINS